MTPNRQLADQRLVNRHARSQSGPGTGLAGAGVGQARPKSGPKTRLQKFRVLQSPREKRVAGP